MKINREKIKLIMANRMKNQIDIQKETGLSYSTISKALLGIAGSPKTIGKIANALNVSVEEILNDENPQRIDNELNEDEKMWLKFNGHNIEK